ncbi:MAG: hypothetical protein IKY27_00435 [Bacteroidales bacterium]|nr:hypothetical protein [Bacteroidales bacterium]MBR5780435.1 hypothetical protein [Bacteroidales bacterium]
MESILTSIKKLLGITEDCTSFDVDIIIHINSVFTILKRLGVGPVNGFRIEDKTAVWTDFIPEDYTDFESVKTYVYQKVRLIFDPPQSSAHMEAIKESIIEFEFSLQTAAELMGEEVT